MSIKLYDGLEIEINNMSDYIVACNEVRKILDNFYYKKINWVAGRVYKKIIIDFLLNGFTSEYIENNFFEGMDLFLDENLFFLKEAWKKDFNFFYNLYVEKLLKDKENEYVAINKAVMYSILEVIYQTLLKIEGNEVAFNNKSFSMMKNFGPQVYLFPLKDKILLYPINNFYIEAEKFTLRNCLLKSDKIKDYHYQNNTDKPKEINKKEWEKRYDDWAQVLDKNDWHITSGLLLEMNNILALKNQISLFKKDINLNKEFHFLSVEEIVKSFYFEYFQKKYSQDILNKNEKITSKSSMKFYRRIVKEVFYEFKDNKIFNQKELATTIEKSLLF